MGGLVAEVGTVALAGGVVTESVVGFGFGGDSY